MRFRIVGTATDAARRVIAARLHSRRKPTPMTEQTPEASVPEVPPIREREFTTSPVDTDSPIPKVYSGHVWLLIDELCDHDTLEFNVQMVLSSLENRVKQGGYTYDKSKVMFQLSAEMVVHE